MAVLDPTTNLGKVRLRIGDFGDIEFLSDEIINSTLTDTSNNVSKASVICSGYILGLLSQQTHRKFVTMEVWGAEAFTNYLAFLKYTVNNPNSVSNYAPVPYAPEWVQGKDIENFVYDWHHNYWGGTQSQWMASTAYPPRKDADYPPFYLGDWVFSGEVPE